MLPENWGAGLGTGSRPDRQAHRFSSVETAGLRARLKPHADGKRFWMKNLRGPRAVSDQRHHQPGEVGHGEDAVGMLEELS
jgi:hypothetical protein